MDNVVLARIIAAIGEPDFPAVATEALRALLDFDLTAALAHPANSHPVILFDNFDTVGARQGLANYAQLTHAVNPMLAHARPMRVCRASDFALARDDLGGMDAHAGAHVVASEEEELGFRTVGWPARLEEIAFYLDAGGNLVELGFYRDRRRGPVQADALTTLQQISQPVASAFARHFTLGHRAPAPAAVLTAREREVCELMLRGCASQAIAAHLGISRHTVKDHRKAIFRKLAVGSLAELFALQAARH